MAIESIGMGIIDGITKQLPEGYDGFYIMLSVHDQDASLSAARSFPIYVNGKIRRNIIFKQAYYTVDTLTHSYYDNGMWVEKTYEWSQQGYKPIFIKCDPGDYVSIPCRPGIDTFADIHRSKTPWLTQNLIFAFFPVRVNQFIVTHPDEKIFTARNTYTLTKRDITGDYDKPLFVGFMNDAYNPRVGNYSTGVVLMTDDNEAEGLNLKYNDTRCLANWYDGYETTWYTNNFANKRYRHLWLGSYNNRDVNSASFTGGCCLGVLVSAYELYNEIKPYINAVSTTTEQDVEQGYPDFGTPIGDTTVPT